MTITIDKTRALELLEKAVEARGADYQYQQEFGDECVYVGYRLDDLDEGGEAEEDAQECVGCIAGEALNQAGIDIVGFDLALVEALPRLAGFVELVDDGPGITEACTPRLLFDDADGMATWPLAKHVESELAYNGVELTEAATRVWWVAQRMQDHGKSWGDALEKAREVAALLGDAQ